MIYKLADRVNKIKPSFTLEMATVAAEMKSKGVEINENNLILSESASLILPYHKEMDEIREDSAGKAKIGTTRRGIGPAYEDKVGRRSIRVMDLTSESNLDSRLDAALIHHNALRKGLKKTIFKKDKLKKELLKIASPSKTIIISFLRGVSLLILMTSPPRRSHKSQ